MTVSIGWALAICILGYVAWLGSKAWEQGERFSLLPTYLVNHFGRAFLGAVATVVLFIINVVFRESALTPSELTGVFFMSFGAISFISHGPKKKG